MASKAYTPKGFSSEHHLPIFEEIVTPQNRIKGERQGKESSQDNQTPSMLK
jgi:hypothetical protein